jgi:hypothetical protein
VISKLRLLAQFEVANTCGGHKVVALVSNDDLLTLGLCVVVIVGEEVLDVALGN